MFELVEDLRKCFPGWGVEITELQQTVYDPIGFCDFARKRILIEARMTPTSQRCVLAHEIEHLRRGHRKRCDPATEREVVIAVARQLIPLDELIAYYTIPFSPSRLAAQLQVDHDTLIDRLDTLTPEETWRLATESVARQRADLERWADCLTG